MNEQVFIILPRRSLFLARYETPMAYIVAEISLWQKTNNVKKQNDSLGENIGNIEMIKS